MRRSGRGWRTIADTATRTTVSHATPKAIWNVVVALASADEGSGGIDLTRQARQILANRCFVCHGPDEGSRQSGLRLDRREHALAAAESGLAAIIPGQPETSQLLIRVASSDAELRMPPAESGPPLSLDEVAALKQWIAAGAPARG